MLNPRVGLTVMISSPFNFFTIVVFPALSRPLKISGRAPAEQSPMALRWLNHAQEEDTHFALLPPVLPNNSEQTHGGGSGGTKLDMEAQDARKLARCSDGREQESGPATGHTYTGHRFRVPSLLLSTSIALIAASLTLSSRLPPWHPKIRARRARRTTTTSGAPISSLKAADLAHISLRDDAGEAAPKNPLAASAGASDDELPAKKGGSSGFGSLGVEDAAGEDEEDFGGLMVCT